MAQIERPHGHCRLCGALIWVEKEADKNDKKFIIGDTIYTCDCHKSLLLLVDAMIYFFHNGPDSVADPRLEGLVTGAPIESDPKA